MQRDAIESAIDNRGNEAVFLRLLFECILSQKQMAVLTEKSAVEERGKGGGKWEVCSNVCLLRLRQAGGEQTDRPCLDLRRATLQLAQAPS